MQCLFSLHCLPRAVLALPFLLAGLPDEAAARDCGFRWAVPGQYEVRGAFHGRPESAGARLSSDCRVSLQIPGVFAAGRLAKAGNCLKFGFKVEGDARQHVARWCNGYGMVPWKGRAVRTTVTLRKASR